MSITNIITKLYPHPFGTVVDHYDNNEINNQNIDQMIYAYCNIKSNTPQLSFIPILTIKNFKVGDEFCDTNTCFNLDDIRLDINKKMSTLMTTLRVTSYDLIEARNDDKTKYVIHVVFTFSSKKLLEKMLDTILSVSRYYLYFNLRSKIHLNVSKDLVLFNYNWKNHLVSLIDNKNMNDNIEIMKNITKLSNYYSNNILNSIKDSNLTTLILSLDIGDDAINLIASCSELTYLSISTHNFISYYFLGHICKIPTLTTLKLCGNFTGPNTLFNIWEFIFSKNKSIKCLSIDSNIKFNQSSSDKSVYNFLSNVVKGTIIQFSGIILLKLSELIDVLDHVNKHKIQLRGIFSVCDVDPLYHFTKIHDIFYLYTQTYYSFLILNSWYNYDVNTFNINKPFKNIDGNKEYKNHHMKNTTLFEIVKLHY